MSDIFGSPSKTASSTQTGQSSVSQGTSDSQSNSATNSTSNSSSSNQAYSPLLQALGGQANTGTGASNALASLLGVGGNPAAQQQAFDAWKKSTGYQFGLDQGMEAINGNQAAKGLLNSGSTLKALDTYGQNYANTQFQNYLNPLQSLISSGNQAAGVIGNTGGISNSNSNTNSSSNSNSNSQNTSNALMNSISMTDARGENKGTGGDILGNVLSLFSGGK